MTNKTLPQAFFESAAKYNKKRALSYKKNGSYYHISYKELADKIKIFANNLIKLRVKQGDNLAILSKNCPEWVIFDLGTMLVGGVTVPIHSTLSPKIIAYILNHSEAKILVVNGAELLNKVLLVQDQLEFLKSIIYIGQKEADLDFFSKIKILYWNELFLRSQEKESSQIKIKSSDICSIIYTSGTTGLPKGVCLTHNNFLSDIEATKKSIPLYHTDIFLSFLPLSHVLERMGGYYYPLLIGASIAYAESTKDLPKNLREIHPTVLIAVPRIFERFYEAIFKKIKKGPKWKENLFFRALKAEPGTITYKIFDILVFKKIRRQLGGNLRLAISGGAALDAKIGKFFSKIGLTIVEGYGLTETSPVIAVNKPRSFKFGTVGQVIDGVEAKISSDREILVRGPIVMTGYYRNDSETKQAIDDEGWLHTGDLGFFDRDGFLTIIGRKKEMMVSSGGKNIWPEPIENQLTLSKYINQAVIIGHKRKFVSALIIPTWEEVREYFNSIDETFSQPENMINNDKVKELIWREIEAVNINLAEHEKIKKIVLLPNELSEAKDELTPTLKLRRNTIESNYKKEIEFIYSNN